MRLDQALVDAAIELAETRWPAGESGAAAMYTEDGRILTSVFAESPNDAAGLCHETGAICEAHKLGVAVTASVCVARYTENDPFVILTACGICQERLAFWGGDVEIAVPDPSDPTRWRAKRLREVQPYYWLNVERKL
jgi:cytidine deaminase